MLETKRSILANESVQIVESLTFGSEKDLPSSFAWQQLAQRIGERDISCQQQKTIIHLSILIGREENVTKDRAYQ